MGTGQLFNTYIDLPKSAYYFTLRVTFWQAFFSILSIFFMSMDTAINDIIEHMVASISHNLRQKTETIMMRLGGLFVPQVACA